MNRIVTTLAAFVFVAGCSVEPAKPLPRLGEGPAEPFNVRLSYNDDPSTTLAVIWQTEGPLPGAGVEFGPDASYGSFVAAKSFTLENQPDFDGIYFHEATLRGLKPGSVVNYRVGGRSGVSPNHTAATAPLEDDAAFSFVLLGDARGELLGVGAGYSELNAQLLREAPLPSFILDSGDYTLLSQASEWQQWLEVGSEVGSVIPRLPTLGNHEFAGLLYFDLMNLPTENDEQFYTLRFGALQIIGLDTGVTGGDVIADQTEWLKGVLKESTAPWKVVFFHKPPYNAGNHHKEAERHVIRQHWVPLFEEYNVDLVVSGHDHNYQRFGHIKGGTRALDGKAPFYLISGGAGAPTYPMEDEAEDAPLIEKFEETEHYILANLDGNKLTLTAKRLDGTVFDTIELTKD